MQTNQSLESLVDVGFAPPTWETEIVHPPHVEDREHQPRVGWQAQADREVESSFLENLQRQKVRSLGPKEGHWLLLRLSVSQRIAPRIWNHNSSGSCSCADCVSLSLFQPVPDVAVLSTSLAIIGRLALLLGRWDAEGSL